MTIDISGAIYRKLQSAEQAATQSAKSGDFANVAQQLRICHRLMTQYAEQAGVGGVVHQMRMKKAEEYLAQAQKVAEQARQTAALSTQALTPEMESRDANYRSIIESLITRVEIGWDEIAGLDETKEEIRINYALGLLPAPAGIEIQTTRNLLFFGPPGTGKTMLAGAVSNELDATFFNVRLSDLLSQYFGESSKLLSALYKTAAQHAPAVIFLDELDALARRRGSGQESGAERRLLNTLLSELDGLQQKGRDTPLVLTIGATNVPWELDNALLSRFSGGCIYVPLPDSAARVAMLELFISRRGHSSDLSIPELAEMTEGYSGREIDQLVTVAIRSMLRNANPSLLEVARLGKSALQAYRLQTDSVADSDWDRAFEYVRPSTTDRMLIAYENWKDL